MIKVRKKAILFLLMFVWLNIAGCTSAGSYSDSSETKDKVVTVPDNSDASSQTASDGEDAAGTDGSADADYEEGEISF